MKKYSKEIIILIIQLLVFYFLPLFARPSDSIGLIFLIVNITLILSIVIAYISTNKIKYLYPIVISVLFIPSVYIYYNDSALIHSIWYLIVSLIGLAVGIVINKLKSLINKKNN